MKNCDTNIYCLEDKLLHDLRGIPQFSKRYIVKSERPNDDFDNDHLRFIREYTDDLEKFVEKITKDKIIICVEEILTNMEDHGHKYDPTKSTLIITNIFDNGVLVSLQGEGPGYDVTKVRQSTINPDGSVYMGRRGRGHAMLKFSSDRAFTQDSGREWYLIFDKNAA